MSKKYKIVMSILIVAALLVVVAGAAVIIIGQRENHVDVVEGLNKENESLEREGEKLESDLEALKDEKRIFEAKIAELEANLSDSGKYFEDEIAALKAELDEKLAEISALESDIEKYRTVFSIDVRAQAQLIDEIVEYIESASPYVSVPVIDEDGLPTGENEWVLISELIEADLEALGDEPLFTPEELAASGLTEEELTDKLLRERVFAREDVEYPSIGVYYEDLTTGYHFDYEATKIFDAASVIKAPYILSLLKKVSADEKAFYDRITNEDGFVPEMIDTDGDGEPDEIIIEYSDPIYDLTEPVIYEKETMWKSGSGKIKDMEDGAEFTYLDFVKYALEYSDNIAYQQLRSRFGFSLMQELALSLKANSIFKGGNSMSAADAGKLFKAIYKFTEEDEKYGPIMADSMKKSGHTVIIPYAVSPTKVMHKYGWDTDAYNDVGIVLSGDNPYVIAVFSNLDCGGAEVNAYLQEIVRLINKLHKGFYNS